MTYSSTSSAKKEANQVSPNENQLKKRSKASQILAGVLVNAFYEMKNYPIVLVSTVLSPLSFLLLVVFVSRGTLIGEAVIGGFILTVFQSGMSLQSDLAHLKNDFKLQDMIVASPTNWLTYIVGLVIGDIIYSLPALIVLTILAYYFLTLSIIGALGLIAVLLLMFLVSMAIGYALSTYSSDIVQSFAFSRLLATLFSTLPPVYYPITFIPLPYRYLAYLSPTTYAAELAQSAAGFVQPPLTNIILDWIIIVAVTIALFIVAATKARWREV
jgi:ABC-2 type transport system permease protein